MGDLFNLKDFVQFYQIVDFNCNVKVCVFFFLISCYLFDGCCNIVIGINVVVFDYNLVEKAEVVVVVVV